MERVDRVDGGLDGVDVRGQVEACIGEQGAQQVYGAVDQNIESASRRTSQPRLVDAEQNAAGVRLGYGTERANDLEHGGAVKAIKNEHRGVMDGLDADGDAQHVMKRDLEPWEIVAVGALSGGLAAVVTTPFDVMKTRMMTAPPGTPVSMQMIVFSILRNEGPIVLFKGAIPRFFWIAPLGAMNFAGYELAKKVMIKDETESRE
nr:unnamed protein product [Digitaria exilis]